MTRDELLAALESATGPSRELDRALAEFVGLEPYCDEYPVTDWFVSGGHPVACYTESIDAALTLVPEGWYGRIQFGGPYDCAVVMFDRDESHPRSNAVSCDLANTPALALCIAALRARMTGDD